MSQAFTRLGTQVTVIEMGDTILRNDDPGLVTMLQEQAGGNEGIHGTYLIGAGAKKVSAERGAHRH